MMVNARRILFVCWDSPSVTYLEGLFVPIFARLAANHPFEFHVIQFSWAGEARIQELTRFCQSQGIKYTHVPVSLKPFALIGKYRTLIRGAQYIRQYIEHAGITDVIPRSTMPAKMVKQIVSSSSVVNIIFDADGLPIEERVDFASLAPGSLRYRSLKRIEKAIVTRAKIVLTRTIFAADYLSLSYNLDRSKFFKVVNGRDKTIFSPDHFNRHGIRRSLGLNETDLVLVYCGSLGPQYGVEQMLYIHRKLLETHNSAHLLVLTNRPDYILALAGVEQRLKMSVKSVAPGDIPMFLSAADVALAIRKPTFSMKGVAPIKLGEYLLMGLPTIASRGIGDTDQMLAGKPFAFVLENYDEHYLDQAVSWIERLNRNSDIKEEARAFGLTNFSLEAAASTYFSALEAAQVR